MYMSAWSRDMVWTDGNKRMGYQEFKNKRKKTFFRFRQVAVDWSCEPPVLGTETTAHVFCTYDMYFTKKSGKTFSEHEEEVYIMQKESAGWKIRENRDYL